METSPEQKSPVANNFSKQQDLIKCKEYLVKSENWIKTTELKLAAADDVDHPAEERKVCEVSTYLMCITGRHIHKCSV